jgi:anion-transporting  ArsA/GET3 family ATPase
VRVSPDPVRLHVVTGKGGTGKTTVAAALALALAADGRSVLLVETEGRQGIAQLFDTPPLPYEERRVAVTRGGGEVKALANDAVVVDAPPTGRITRFLGVTAEMSQLARSGPIKTQSDGVMAVLRSPQTAVHLVTVLEDMPVQETADAITELTKADLPVGAVVVNMATEPVLPADGLALAARGGLTGDDLAPALAAAHLHGGPELAGALAAEVTEHAQRWTGQDALRDEVEALGRPTVELPLLTGPMDLGSLFELAARLEEHLQTEAAA